MRPVIGLIPLFDDEKDSYWMLPGYMKVIEECRGKGQEIRNCGTVASRVFI